MGRARDLANILSSSGSVALDSELGLSLITPTSIATTGGSATSSISSTGTVSFTSASAISLNSCFSSTYDNYLIIFKATSSSATTSLSLRLRNGGTDLSSASYDRSGTITYNTVSTISALNQQGATSIGFPDINATYPEYTQFSFIIFNPFLAKIKGGHLQGAGVNGTSQVAGMQFNCAIASASSYDGFSLITASGTFGGTLSVYGYRK